MFIRRREDKRFITSSGINIQEVPELNIIVNRLRELKVAQLTNAGVFICKNKKSNKIYYLVRFVDEDNIQRIIGWYGPNKAKAYKREANISAEVTSSRSLVTFNAAATDKLKKKYTRIPDLLTVLKYLITNDAPSERQATRTIADIIATRI